MRRAWRPARSSAEWRPESSRFLQSPCLQDLLAQELPDLHAHSQIFRRFPIVAGPIDLRHADVHLDATRARCKDDDPGAEIDRFVNVVRDEQRGLAIAMPDRLQ